MTGTLLRRRDRGFGMVRLQFLVIGLALLGVGAYMVQDRLDHGSSRARGNPASVMVFIGGVYFLAKAAIPGDDDQK